MGSASLVVGGATCFVGVVLATAPIYHVMLCNHIKPYLSFQMYLERLLLQLPHWRRSWRRQRWKQLLPSQHQFVLSAWLSASW